MTGSAAAVSFLLFGVCGHEFAVPLTRVLEIVGCRHVVRVPRAGESVRGLMNLRGSVVPVVDVARHLGMGDTKLSETTCVVLIETDINGDNSPLAGLVDEIHGVLELSNDEVAEAPEFGTPVDRRLLSGVTPPDRGTAWLLDLDAMLSSLA